MLHEAVAKAKEHYGKGELPLAVEVLEVHLRDQSEDGEGWNLFGMIHYASGKSEEAREALEKAVELMPTIQVRYNLAVALGALKKYDEAERILLELEGETENNAMIANALGRFYWDRDQVAQARTWLEKAVDRDDNDPAIHKNLAELYHYDGDFPRAQSHCGFAEKMAPEDPDVKVKRGELFADMGLWKEAVEAYKEAMALSPRLAKDPFIYQTIRQIYGQMIQPSTWRRVEDQRMQAFLPLFQKHLSAQTRVAELAPEGVGELALLAAKQTATRATLFSVRPFLAGTFKECAKANGVEERVDLAESFMFIDAVEKGEGQSYDLLIADLFHEEFPERRRLQEVAMAAEHLLKPGGTITPGAVTLYAVPVTSDLLKERTSAESTLLETGPLNKYKPLFFHETPEAVKATPLADPLLCHRFPLGEHQSTIWKKSLTFTATISAPCHGIMCWLEREVEEGTTVDRGYEKRYCYFQLLDFDTKVKEGEPLEVELHYRDKPFFFIKVSQEETQS